MKPAKIFFPLSLLLVLSSAFSSPVQIAAIDDSYVGEVVTIEGEVFEKTVLENGNISLTVGNSSDSIQTLIFASLAVDHERFSTGTYVEVTGKIEKYKGTLEIQPRDAEEIRTFGELSQPITTSDVGSIVRISGQVFSKYDHPKGHLFLRVLINGTGQEMDVRIFDVAPFFRETVSVDSLIRVRGEVREYKGKLQVVPESDDDVRVVVSQVPTETPKLVSIGDITREDRGKFFQVRAIVEAISHSDSHTFVMLLDINMKDRAKAVLFRADAEEIIGRKVKLVESYEHGAPVRLLVSADVYNDELQLIIDKVYNRF